MKNLNLTELQAKKYEIIRLTAVLRLKLARGWRIDGEKALESALESAVNENSAIGSFTLANHSASLPFEAQQALAEELLAFCQGKYSEEDHAYLRTSVERFFQKNSPQQEREQKPANHEFSHEMYVVVKSALEQKKLITSSDIYTGKPTHLKALYNVLEKRGYILGIKKPEDSFATWFETYFGFKITDRTLRNPPNKGQVEEEEDFKALIPDNK